MHKPIDLHIHTTASDGSMPADEVVKTGQELGLGAVGIADHDTVDGVALALETGEQIGMNVVPGVELSTDLREKTVHVLGYFLDHQNSFLLKQLDWAKGVRASRNHKIVARFNELGIDLNYDEVKAKAGGDVVGRPHFARTLKDKGIVSKIQEAFDIYLGYGGKAYVSKFRFTPAQSMELIIKAGGLPVLAHPGQYDWTPLELDDAIGELCELGLVGLEILHSDHTPAQELIFADIAKSRGLLPTGGTDFHGKSKPEIKLGIGKGNMRVPYAWYEALKERAKNTGR